jgi:hypothetical protein
MNAKPKTPLKPNCAVLPVLEACEPRLLLSGWSIQDLEWGYSQGDIGRYTSIAVAEKDTSYPQANVDKGTVFISCYDNTDHIFFDYHCLVYYSGKVRSSIGPRRLVGSGDFGQFTSIALDSGNVAHIAYYDAGVGAPMYVRNDNSNAWSGGYANRRLDYSGNCGKYTALALDSKDLSHVIYYDSANGKIRYTFETALNSWTDPVELATVGAVSETGATKVHRLASLAMDKDDHPHVSFYDANSQSLKYMEWTGKAWTAPVTLDGGAGANVGVDNTMKLDRQGHPHIAYYDAVNQDLKYVQWNGTQWTTPIVLDSADIVGQYASMDMDGSGYPHISYGYTQYPFEPNSQITNPRLKYARWDGSAWQISVIDSEMFGAFEYTSCYVDGAGTAYVSYFLDWNNYVGRKLKLAVAADMGAVPNPDLAVEVKLPAGQTWLPGDRVSVPVTVTDIGADAAVGPVTVTLYGSPDNTLDLSGNDPDPEIGDLTAGVNLAQGQSKDFVFSLTIPPDAIPGSYYLIAVAEASPAINETKTANNLDVSDNTLEIIWQAGTFGDRSNFALSVMDLNGVVTKFSLSGGGYAQIIGGDDFTQLVIQDTTPNSVLTITAPAGTITEIGDIVVNGSLKGLIAKTVVLDGSLTVGGTIGTLVLNDVQDDHVIDLNTLGLPVDPKLGLTIALDQVADCSLDTNGIPIKSLTVTEWLGDGTIQAPWIGALTVKGDKKRTIAGSFEADLKLASAPPMKPILGAVKIAGDLADAEWNLANGTVAGIQVGGKVRQLDLDDAGAIKSFKAAGFEDSEVSATGEIGAFVVGAWEDSDLVADSVKSLTSGDFSHGLLVLQGYHALGKPVLGSAKVGNITDSAQDPDSRGWVVMGDVGAVTVGDVNDWYFRADKAVKSIKAGVVSDSKAEIGGLLGSMTAKSWVGGSIMADSAGTISTTGDKKLANVGDFVANIGLAGKYVQAGKLTLGAIKVAGNVGVNAPTTVEWYLHGDVGTIATKGDIWNLVADSTAIGNLKALSAGTAHDTQIKATGAIGTLQVKEWDTGKLEADSLVAFKITGDAKGGIQGELRHFDMLLHGANVLTGKPALATMTVADEVHESTLYLHGNAGVLTAGAFDASNLYLGCTDVTGSIDDFSSGPGIYNQFTLAGLNLKGVLGQTRTYYFHDSEVGAYNVGAVRFGGDPQGISGTIQYNQLGSVTPPLVGGSASVLTKV